MGGFFLGEAGGMKLWGKGGGEVYIGHGSRFRPLFGAVKWVWTLWTRARERERDEFVVR